MLFILFSTQLHILTDIWVHCHLIAPFQDIDTSEDHRVKYNCSTLTAVGKENKLAATIYMIFTVRKTGIFDKGKKID